MAGKQTSVVRRAVRAGAWLAAAALLLLGGLWVACPFPRERLDRFPGGAVLLDRRGDVLRVTLGPGDVDCRPLYAVEKGDWIVPALIACEDQRFFRHPGLDPLALARAISQNVSTGRRVSGASTLSTQVIRLLDQRPRSWWSKAVEAFRALQLERQLGKRSILAQYLNRAPFGGNIVGIEAASRRYFGKGPHELSLAEAALLAGLPQSPSRLRPDRRPAAARARQRYVLDRMVACGLITDAQRRGAAAMQVSIRHTEYPMRAPHFAEAVLAQLPPGGASGVLRTTLDPGWQTAAESALRRQVEALRPQGISGGAVVVVDVARGEVCALAGSPDYFGDGAGQVNGALAQRSAGSTLKPFLYALALDGALITPSSRLADVPVSYSDYRPQNFDESFLGLVSARDALVLSLNVPCIELTKRLGVPRAVAALRRFGLSTLDRPAGQYGLGIAVGNAEVRLVDLVAGYAALARGGVARPLRFCAADAPGGTSRVCSAEAAWLVADALGGSERAMQATGHRADVLLPRLAWKTGTSSGLRDAWTVAYNPEFVVGVWIGNPDGASSPALVGADAAAPVAWELMRSRYPDGAGPWFAKPRAVMRRPVCALSGEPPGRHCGALSEDWFIRGSSSPRPCEVHGADGREHWPPEVSDYLSRQGVAPAATDGSELAMLSPVEGTVYRYVDGWEAGVQTLPLRAAGAGTVYWFVDGACVGEARAGESLPWPLERGDHRIVCSSAVGRSVTTRVRVE